MPCKEACDVRLLLLVKENRLSKLYQTKKWIDELGQLEPERGEEILIKLNIVNNKSLNQ